jgi:hypothetical protein
VVLTGNRCSRRHRMLLERRNIDEALIAFRRAVSGSGLGCERFATSLATGLTRYMGHATGSHCGKEPVTKLDPLVTKPRDTD